MPLDPHGIITNLEEEIIDTMLGTFFKDEDEIFELGRGMQLKALSDSAITTGVDYILNKCTKQILCDLERGEAYSTGGPENEKSRPKPIVVENLSLKSAERGFAEFLRGKDAQIISTMAEKLKIDGDDKDDIIEKIVEEANLQGLTRMFETFSPKTLKDWCALMDIEINSTSKKRLAKGLIFGQDSGPTSTRQYSKTEKEKVKLEKGVSEEDIKTSYTVNELKKFCTDSEIPQIGTKDVLVNRIYRFLQGETIDPEEGKKRKRTGDGEEPAPVKKQKVEEPPPLSSSSEEEDDSGDDYMDGHTEKIEEDDAENAGETENAETST